MPERIQLRRTKSWRLPENAVVVARPSKWGNPWVARELTYGLWEVYDRTREQRLCLKRRREDAVAQCVAYYRTACDPRQPDHLRWRLSLGFEPEEISRLRGKDLACWCPPGAACHADVLLELANAPLRCEGV